MWPKIAYFLMTIKSNLFQYWIIANFNIEPWNLWTMKRYNTEYDTQKIQKSSYKIGWGDHVYFNVTSLKLQSVTQRSSPIPLIKIQKLMQCMFQVNEWSQFVIYLQCCQVTYSWTQYNSLRLTWKWTIILNTYQFRFNIKGKNILSEEANTISIRDINIYFVDVDTTVAIISLLIGWKLHEFNEL